MSMKKHKAIAKLIDTLGGQTPAARALGVSAPTVNGWVSGKHGISPLVAMRAERVTGGKVAAVDLCPAIRAEMPAA